ncbi:EAL domain-containing protein, partial [Klebsiella pneumoniae]|uniref:EAL domain-containing protein n=1 Tax=Klebsiella pneumoniae TaxID=573 RepID=UPI0020C807ED
GKNSLNRLIRCVCGKKIGPDPRNFNQRVSLGRNDLLIRTFLSGIAHVARDLSIVRSIVSLGKAFSLGIVAEGVENNEQFELLKNMNCDEFQGYYYSKPLSGDQLIDFLRGQKK